MDPCLGENAPPQRRVLTACKSGAAIPLWCAVGTGARANPECFVILLSSNPISISGHSINRIKIWLKVIMLPAYPWAVSLAPAGPAIAAQPSAMLLVSPQGFHHCRVLGVARAADRAGRVQHHHREVGAVPLAPSHPSRASVLLMDEVTVALLSEPFTFIPKVSQKCSNRKYFP